jgi:hypothetical protein
MARGYTQIPVGWPEGKQAFMFSVDQDGSGGKVFQHQAAAKLGKIGLLWQPW